MYYYRANIRGACFIEKYDHLYVSFPANQGQSNSGQVDPAFLDQLQHLQQLLLKNQEASNEPKSSVKFDKKLLDFDYGEEEEDDVVLTNSPNTTTSANTQHNAVSANSSLESLGLLLANPEVCTVRNYDIKNQKIVSLAKLEGCYNALCLEGPATVANLATDHAGQRLLVATRDGGEDAQVAADEAAGRRI